MLEMGIKPTSVVAAGGVPEYGVGQRAAGAASVNAGGVLGMKEYIYVQDSGSGITGEGYICVFDPVAGTAVMATTTNTAGGTGQGKLFGIAQAAIAANGYGWLQIYGLTNVNVLTLAAAYTQINTTATAGTADDDATAGARVLHGLNLTTARGASTGLAPGFISWPWIGRTL